MMLEPAMNRLLKRVPSRYMLVNVVAHRARQIASQAEDEGVHLEDKPVTLALFEVANRENESETEESLIEENGGAEEN